VTRGRRMLCTLALAAAGASFGPRPLAAQFDTTYGCLACHAAQREAFTVGVHAQHGVQCTACHGGDPSERALPAAHHGLSGKLDKVATARLCGSCHSDPNRMRQYRLPTDQLAEFRTSRHGELLLERRDADAPTCTDCHGTHVIYPPDDARSRVYPTNIPGTCAGCHSDRQLMAKYHLPTNQFAQFRTSAHGVALFQHQNFAAPTCVGCHGAHSALPPTVTEIPSVCGRCHQLIDQAFARSPHAAVAERGGFPGCLACHSNHGTERVAADSIAPLCAKCHGSDVRIRTTALRIQEVVAKATDNMRSAGSAIGRLSLAGERVGDYRFRYQTAMTYYLEIAQVQHSLDLSQLDDLGRRVRSISVDLGEAAEANAEHRWEHRLLLIVVWFFALSTAALGWLTLRGLKEANEGREE
jgi:predicted CXXCH cytochrome family protein